MHGTSAVRCLDFDLNFRKISTQIPFEPPARRKFLARLWLSGLNITTLGLNLGKNL